MTSREAPYVVSLADVATLAAVDRPVVTMWRNRPSAAGPFPLPVAGSPGNERFDASAVAAWLTRSGRGHATDVNQDLPEYAVPLGLADDPANFDVLTSLICLRALAQDSLEGRSTADIRDIARQVDPLDQCLRGEIHAAADERLELMTELAERLVGSSYSLPAAFDWALDNPQRYATKRLGLPRLTSLARRLMADLAWALSLGLNEPVRWVDVTYGGSDIVPAIAAAAGSGDADDADLTVSCLAATSQDPVARTEARLALRRLRTHGWTADILGPGPLDEATADVTGPAMYLAQFPTAATSRQTPTGILNRIEQIALRLDQEQVAVVVAPAATLTDRLVSAQARRCRSDLVREGYVRAAVRLPRGIVATAPRQAGALWILGPSQATRAIRERRVCVADMGHLSLGQISAGDLADDISAATGSRRSLHAHAFTYSSVVPTPTLLTGAGTLVPAVTGPRSRVVAPPALGIDVSTLRRQVAQPVAGTSLPEVTVGVADRLDVQTLGDAAHQGWARVMAGHRLAGVHLQGEGIPVVGVPELLGAETVRFVDLLTFIAAYPRAHRTEPGDVIFCTSPRSATRVDARGGTVVEFPARILRFTNPTAHGIVPALVAADITGQGRTPQGWTAWPLRTVDRNQVAAVAGALDLLDEARRTASARVRDLERLASLLADGVATGALTLASPLTQRECNDSPREGD